MKNKNRFARWLFVAAGCVCLGVGLLGIFLPLLPTTVFLLISAACFARSSDRLYNWLLSHKWFGSYIKNWREHKAITLRTKVTINAVLWSTLAISAALVSGNSLIHLFLLATGIGVSWFIFKIKTLTDEAASGNK